MKTMTQKDLHIAIKNGATEEELIARYGVINVEELYKMIGRICVNQRNLDAFKKAIRQNEKKARKCSGNDGEAGPKETMYGETDVDSSKVSEEVPQENILETTEDIPTLAELLEAEEFFSKNCIALEQEHQNLITARRKDIEELAAVKKTLEELKRLLVVNKEKMTSILEDYNSKLAQMAKYSTEIAACKEMLNDTRMQIEEMQKVKILVYSEGAIECENGDLEEPDANEVATMVSSLILLAEAEELTIKQIKTVAKLVLMVKKLDKKFELEFDSDLVQKLYEAVIS